MGFLRLGIGSLIFLVAAVVVLNLELGTETVVQAYYTHEPLKYDETFLREGTTSKWQWGWPPRVTVPQVQYGLKNLDSVEGEFLVSVSFCPASSILAGWRQLVLPVHLLFLTPLLGSIGAVAGDVELQDDGVMHHPVDGSRGGHGVGEDPLPLREDQV